MVYLIALYLTAIVAANLTIAHFGANVAVSFVASFAFIAVNLTVRDALHEYWEHKHLWRNMALLIGGGSLLSALLNWNALPIAIASLVAFAGAGVADTLVYQALGERARLVKMNGSNLVSAAVDSVLFPLLAFGFPLQTGVMAGDFTAKVLGGAVWSYVLTRRMVATESAA